jgi:NodT family efflux transporter outer membrane factor (OMF) lipoprotein
MRCRKSNSSGKIRWAGILAAAAAALCGCAVGPDFQRPRAPDAGGYTPEPLAPTAAAETRGGQAQRFVRDLDIPGQWWTLFRCDALNRLIQQALENNPDIDVAQAALRQANEQVRAREGALFPSADGGIQAERERLAGAIIGEPHYNPTFSVITASLSVSYVPDVFGGTRRRIESLAAQADYQRFQLEATYLTLTSNLVVAAVQEASLRGRIAATEQVLKIEGGELNLIRQRFQVGVVSRADILLQETTIDQTRGTLPPLRKQLAQVRNRLAALVGRLPDQGASESFDLDGLRLPEDLPVSLPSQLVEQRPDVRAVEAQLHAASAGVGVATANQLPQFSITGAVGTTTTGLGTLPGTEVWSLGGGIAQTLFDAGTLLHEKRAAVAAFDEATAEYRSTVLKAFQNVSDALRALQADADDLVAQDATERSAFASLELARRQFHADTIDYVTVLIAERAWQQARINRIQAEGNRYADTAALFQALGGGWWHRADVSRDRKPG